MCLCNALMANVGLGQLREDGRTELPLVTSGDDLAILDRFLRGRTHHVASDVLSHLLGGHAGGVSSPAHSTRSPAP
jgi:hypothetical protein